MTAPSITMYATGVCPFCTQAERLLRARGVQEIIKVRVDLEPSMRHKMMQETGRRTVPQIWIGDLHVGGYDDLVALDQAGRLAPLLSGHPEGER
ncbi:MAG: glutaredoxin 3 [Betaproteobacteria bacterium]